MATRENQDGRLDLRRELFQQRQLGGIAEPRPLPDSGESVYEVGSSLLYDHALSTAKTTKPRSYNKCDASVRE